MSKKNDVSKQTQQQSSATTNVTQLRSRPFTPEVQAQTTTEQPTLEEVQTQREQQSRLGHNFADIALGAPTPPPPPSNRFPVQAKLTIGQPNDKYEQEADRVAQDVVQRMHSSQSQGNSDTLHQSDNSKLQRQEIDEEDELQMKPDRIQLKANTPVQSNIVQADFESTLNQSKGSGLSLDNGFRAKVESAMGADFSGVKVHTDATANQLSQSIQAKAFTTGQDIFFKQGQYDPGSRSGQELLAHELTHVVQQRGATVQRKSDQSITQPGPQVSRAPIGTIQRLPMSLGTFDNEIKAHWPRTSTALPALHRKLKHFYKNLRFLSSDRQLAQIKEMRQDAKAWVDDPAHGNHPKTIKGLKSFIETLDTEITNLTKPQQGSQGTSQVSNADTNAEVKAIYDRNVYAPIYTAISEKLGIGRSQWLRSNQLNAFRQKLKDAARSQAYLDIDAVAADVMKGENEEESTAFQHYYATKAKVKAYTESKDFVNKVVKDLAATITKAAVPEDVTCNILTEDAQNAAAGYKNPTKAMLSRAKTIVQEKVGRTKGANAGEAIQAARDITKGSKTADKVKELGTKIEDDIQSGDKKFARTTLQTVIQADTLDKGFQKLGKMVDLAVPSPGSSCEVDIQLKVPVGGQSGAYFTTRVLGSAEKDSEEGQQEVEAKLEVSAGVGWSALGIVDANIQAGFFFKSKAGTSQKALQQVSYAFYRKLQTDNKNSRVANRIWGIKGADKVKNSKGENMTAGESAEIWAAAMEEQLFYERDSTGRIVTETDPNDPTKQAKKRNEASVEVGWLLAGQAEVNAGGKAKVEGEAKYKRGIRYSAETLGAGLGKHDKTLTELKQAGAGQSRNTIELKSEVEIKALGSGFGCGLEGSISFNRAGVYEVGVEAFAKANTQWGEDKEVWQTALASIGVAAGDLIKKIVDQVRAKELFLDTHGALANIGFTATDLGKFSKSGETLGADLAAATPDVTDGVTGEPGKALGAKQSFKLSAAYSAERTNATDKFDQALEVSISRIRELGYEAEMGSVGLKAKAETAEKLVRVKLGWGKEKKFGGSFLGMGNIGNQGR